MAITYDFTGKILPRLIELYGTKVKSEIARPLGVTPQTFNGWVDRNNAPLTHLFEVCEQHQVRSDWLILGIGPKFRCDELPDLTDKEKWASIPLLSGQAGDDLVFPTSWLTRTTGANPDSLSAVIAKGDAMEPTFKDDDILIIDKTKVSGDGVFAFQADSQLFVKRLQFLPGKIMASSDNTKYAPFELATNDDLKILGAVVARATDFH